MDYGETYYRDEIEGDSRSQDSKKEALGSMGYQTKECDAESGELVDTEDEEEVEFESDVEADTNLDYVESFDE